MDSKSRSSWPTTGWRSRFCPLQWNWTSWEAQRWRKSSERVDSSPTSSTRALSCGLRPASSRSIAAALSAAGRAGTPDEVGNLAALLMGPDGGFITGSDFLMDGGVTAAYWYGELAPHQN